jgi:hypothetical protein
VGGRVQAVCRSSGHRGQRRESKTTTKATDQAVLRGYVERMVEEKLADRRKQTPGKTQPPRGGQGARAKRESAQAKKDVAASAPCDHCGKKHAGECWYKPGSKKRTRTEKKALKAAAELSRVESGEDTGSEVEETFDNCSRVSLLPPSSRIPRTCGYPSRMEMHIKNKNVSLLKHGNTKEYLYVCAALRKRTNFYSWY